MARTNQSLAEQLRLDEFEIARRKLLLGFGQSDADLLQSAKSLILTHLDGIVDEFYERQTSIAEIALIIGDSETLRRLRTAQRGYITDLFGGYYDLEYVNNRLRIGLVHKRIGVEPKYYLSAVALLKSILTKAIDAKMSDPSVAIRTCEALDKLFFFDTQLVFDTYIRSLLSEIEMSKNEAISHAHKLEEKVAERTKELTALSRSDSLTSLLNKRAFFEEFRMAIARAKRARVPISLLYIDLNNFKQINDTHGHLHGDEILRLTGNAIKSVARETDLCGRFGGDEFCIVLPDTNKEQASVVVRRLHEAVTDRVNIGLSVGVAASEPNNYQDAEEMIRAADSQMYEIKARQDAITAATRTGRSRDTQSGDQRDVAGAAR